MRKSLGLCLGVSAAAVIATALTPAAVSGAPAMSNAAATSSAPATGRALATSTTPASANAPAAGDPSYDTTVTATVSSTGTGLTMTVPGPHSLGTTSEGHTLISVLGADVVTDGNTGLLGWTVVARSTDFTTGAGGSALTIPATDATYAAGGFGAIVGTVAPVATDITLSGTDQTVVTATAAGDNSVTWSPTETLAIPTTAVAGPYTSTLTQSIS